MKQSKQVTRFIVKAATELGTGQGVNGYGRRRLVSGFYVINASGKPVRAFTGKDAEAQANSWAKFCNENL